MSFPKISTRRLCASPAAAAPMLRGPTRMIPSALDGRGCEGPRARPDAPVRRVAWSSGSREPRQRRRPRAAKGADEELPQKRFDPRVVAVRKNATVEFPNADPIYHNVFSVSGANRFDLGLYRSGASKSKKFDEPGLVRVYCNIHPQMVGFVMVVDSDFVAVTGPDGAFRFESVPPGPLRRQGLERGGRRGSRRPSRSRPAPTTRSRSASTSRASRPSRTRTSTARTTRRSAGARR